ncbi:MAG: phage/plasmid primase, P4 family [Candidatus Marinimicrobia bacterium]|nr:phage/plasmid primase, P4 family [Candidatus Neomarinimicrobiota bacterium]MDD5539145.1 phage/plasmid primase, P4 family [Candidatus Neomarinimicrobiota bacterium]
MPNNPMEMATKYVAMGRSVMPTGAPGKDNKHKAPYLDSWKALQNKRAELVQIAQWHNKYHNSLWGMITGAISGVFVIDCDDEASLKIMTEAGLKPHVKTKRGNHFYFKHPGGKIITKANLLPHLDIRGDGGFVNFAGENEGACYEVVIIPTDENLYQFDQLPTPVKNALNKPKSPNLTERILAEAIAKAHPGERNEVGLWLACQLRDNRIPRSDAEPVMRAYTAAVANLGGDIYSEGEAMASLDQAFQREPREPWTESTNGGDDRYLIRGDNGPTLNFNLLVSDLLSEYHFKTFSDTEEVLVYSNGRYLLKGKELIKYECQRRVGITKLISIRVINEIIGHIQRSTYTNRLNFNTSSDTINLNNGLLNINTRVLSPHTHEFLSTIRVPVTYDPYTDCPVIKKFLSEVMSEGDQITLQEFAGYCLLPQYIIQRAVLLQGDGDNGKSTYLNLLKAFVGRENCSNVSWQSLEFNRFASSQLEGKMINIFADLPSRSVDMTTSFKTLTGGDQVESEKKFQNKSSFLNFAKLIFSANKPPMVKDENSYAFWRRWILIEFPFQVPENRKDPKLIEKMTTDSELSGFLNYALDGYARLMKQGKFTYNKTVDETAELYQKNADTVYAFATDRCDISPGATVAKDELYAAYKEYCTENKLPILRPNSFARSLQNQENISVKSFRPNIEGNRPSSWTGIAVREVNDFTDRNTNKNVREVNDFTDRNTNKNIDYPDISQNKSDFLVNIVTKVNDFQLDNCVGAGNDNSFKDDIKNSNVYNNKGKNVDLVDKADLTFKNDSHKPEIPKENPDQNKKDISAGVVNEVMDISKKIDENTQKFIIERSQEVGQRLGRPVVEAHELWEKAGSPELKIGERVISDLGEALIFEEFTDLEFQKLAKWLKLQEGK